MALCLCVILAASHPKATQLFREINHLPSFAWCFAWLIMIDQFGYIIYIMFVHEMKKTSRFLSGRTVIKKKKKLNKFCEIKSIISGVFVPEYLSVSPVLEFRKTRASRYHFLVFPFTIKILIFYWKNIWNSLINIFLTAGGEIFEKR